jgi:hypothetical protein
MAKEMITRITDDIDGSANAEEVSFALDGVEFRIDLAKKNRAALEKALKPYMDAGTRSAHRVSSNRRRGPKASKGRGDLAEIRAWAKGQGMKVSDRGRVSGEVIRAYEAR